MCQFRSLTFLLICVLLQFLHQTYAPRPVLKPVPIRFCENIDLSAFCIIDNHFRLLVYDPWNATIYKYYPQFQEIVEHLFDSDPWREDTQDRGFRRQEELDDLARPKSDNMSSSSTNQPDPSYIVEIEIPPIARVSRNYSVFTYFDMCELTRILPDISAVPAPPPGPPKQTAAAPPKKDDPNPFTLSITEIHVNGVRLHNHLHFTITSEPKKKIRYAFIVVNDKHGWAVGDFNTGVPCGFSDCNCKKPLCHQSRTVDTVPCMFTSDEVVTHPGQMMLYSQDGVEEIHASWRFAQSADPTLFTRELHFKALLLEDGFSRKMQRPCAIDYQFNNIFDARNCSDVKLDCSYSPREGKFGWNPKYDILHPTSKTMGAWDYFAKGYIKRKDVQCHIPISPEHYVREPYPSFQVDPATLKPPAATCKPNERWRATSSNTGPQKLSGALNNLYSALSWIFHAQIYFGVPDAILSDIPDYISPMRNTRNPAVSSPRVTDDLLAFRTLVGIADEERCYCPRFGTPAPETAKVIPHRIQLEGRKDHALQMTVAWILLVPLAIFVSRYYKETYSKVFFLQEYWWYTIHALSLLLALVFMFGGIYGIEVKRYAPFNQDDPAQLRHAIPGALAIALFVCHMMLGMFRIRKVPIRKIQICLHWFFGMMEWLFALYAMYTASFITAGCMSCEALIVLAVFVVMQFIFFLIMEVHMRRFVDKHLHLKPKRRYLPPPVMRIFHKNAPHGKFRIIMLCIYVSFCTICYAVMHYCIVTTPVYESCFDYDAVGTAHRYQIAENQVSS